MYRKMALVIGWLISLSGGWGGELVLSHATGATDSTLWLIGREEKKVVWIYASKEGHVLRRGILPCSKPPKSAVSTTRKELYILACGYMWKVDLPNYTVRKSGGRYPKGMDLVVRNNRIALVTDDEVYLFSLDFTRLERQSDEIPSGIVAVELASPHYVVLAGRNFVSVWDRSLDPWEMMERWNFEDSAQSVDLLATSGYLWILRKIGGRLEVVRFPMSTDGTFQGDPVRRTLPFSSQHQGIFAWGNDVVVYGITAGDPSNVRFWKFSRTSSSLLYRPSSLHLKETPSSPDSAWVMLNVRGVREARVEVTGPRVQQSYRVEGQRLIGLPVYDRNRAFLFRIEAEGYKPTSLRKTVVPGETLRLTVRLSAIQAKEDVEEKEKTPEKVSPSPPVQAQTTSPSPQSKASYRLPVTKEEEKKGGEREPYEWYAGMLIFLMGWALSIIKVVRERKIRQEVTKKVEYASFLLEKAGVDGSVAFTVRGKQIQVRRKGETIEVIR